jgi:hypothetical protein
MIFKKLYLVFFVFLIGTSLHAQNLECPNSISKFKSILDDELHILTNGNHQQLLEYNEKYSYAYEFNNNHPNKRFLSGKWIDEVAYNEELKDFITKVKTKEISIKNLVFHPITGNQIISSGEICVMPVQATIVINDEAEIMISDLIFVRNLQSNEWKNLTYIDFSEEDFKEFFPDFPNDIQLK